MTQLNPVIESVELTKRYKAVTAVDDLTFTVPSGVVVGFLGPNGAGKTTTIRMLLGLVRPSGGEARVLGRPIAEQPAKTLRRIGTLVEAPAFYETHTGRTNLAIHARLAGVDGRRIDEVLELVGLADRAGSQFKTYSLGMKQRLGIANALLTDPDLVILDEPTNGLDPAGIVEVRNLLRSLADRGRTVFVSSHLLAEVQQMCDHVVIINKGRLVVAGPVGELVSGDGRLSVAVPDAASAVRVLGDAGFQLGATRNGWIDVVGARGRGAEINRVLAQGGIFASQLISQERNLEELFLEMTGPAAGGEAGASHG